MPTHYEIMTKADALAAGATIGAIPDLEWMRDADGYDVENSGVFRVVNGFPVELLGTDGGEPEDQSLYRDWSWVASALERAFNLGATENSSPMAATPAGNLPSGVVRQLDELMQWCAQEMHDDVSGAGEQANALAAVAQILGIEGPTPRLDRLYEAD